jgi:hypothetical protein
MRGFLGSGAPFAADLNLIVQLMMGVALIAGTFLAKRRRYRAHDICQTTVLVLNLLMIALVMWPSFQLSFLDSILSRSPGPTFFQQVCGSHIGSVGGGFLPRERADSQPDWAARTSLILSTIGHESRTNPALADAN